MSEQPTLVEQIARDYKAFKSMHQSKVARVPIGLKERVKAAVENGINRNALAAALGITPAAIQRWITSLEPRSRREKLNGESGLVHLKKAISEAQSAEEGGKALRGAGDADWIRLRVQGRELEISSADFWRMVVRI